MICDVAGNIISVQLKLKCFPFLSAALNLDQHRQRVMNLFGYASSSLRIYLFRKRIHTKSKMPNKNICHEIDTYKLGQVAPVGESWSIQRLEHFAKLNSLIPLRSSCTTYCEQHPYHIIHGQPTIHCWWRTHTVLQSFWSREWMWLASENIENFCHSANSFCVKLLLLSFLVFFIRASLWCASSHSYSFTKKYVEHTMIL